MRLRPTRLSSATKDGEVFKREIYKFLIAVELVFNALTVWYAWNWS
jgi:hypothetical protein